MAGNSITISAEQVSQIADNMANQNSKLTQVLEETQKTVNNLRGTWSGQAADETISAYNSFAKKYFESYHELIEQYVKFLRINVVQGYTETEAKNVSLADSFK